MIRKTAALSILIAILTFFVYFLQFINSFALSEDQFAISTKYLTFEYFPNKLKYSLKVNNFQVFQEAYIRIMVNESEYSYEGLRFEGYNVSFGTGALSNFKIIEIKLSNDVLIVKHYVALSINSPVMVTWICITTRSFITLSNIAPIANFTISRFYLSRVYFASKEYWVLPGHFQYGLKEKMYSPVLIKFSDQKLDILVSSLTSETGKFVCVSQKLNRYVSLDFFSLYYPDVITVNPNKTFVSDKVILIFGSNMNLLLNGYSEYVKVFNSLENRTKANFFPIRSRGWISWAYYYNKITSSNLKKEIDFISKDLSDYGYKYIVIDDGWQRRDTSYPAAYDWIEFSSSIGNLTEVINYAHKNNIKVVIWVAFTCYDQNSYLLKDNPEIFLKEGNTIYIENNHAFMNISSASAISYLDYLFSYYKKIGVDGLTFDLATLQFIEPTVRLNPLKNLTSVTVFNNFLKVINFLAEKYDMVILLKGSLEIPSLVKYSRIVSSRVSWDVVYSNVNDPNSMTGIVDSIIKTSFWLNKIIAPDPDALITGLNDKLSDVWNSIQSNFTVLYYGDPQFKANTSLLSNYMIWDTIAEPLESCWFETPPSISLLQKKLVGYETIYGILLVNLKNSDEEFIVNLMEVGVSSPVLVFDPGSKTVFIENKTIFSVKLSSYRSKLLYIVPFELSKPLILSVTGFSYAKEVSYSPEEERLTVVFESPYATSTQLAIYFYKRMVDSVFIESSNNLETKENYSYFSEKSYVSVINVKLSPGINKLSIDFAENKVNYIDFMNVFRGGLEAKLSNLKFSLMCFATSLLAAILLSVLFSYLKQEVET